MATRMTEYGILLENGKWASLYGQTFFTTNRELAEAMLIHNQCAIRAPNPFTGAKVERRRHEDQT